LVVAGDQKQLPPTSFFDRVLEDDISSEDADGGGGLEDYESILDVCCSLGLPPPPPPWAHSQPPQGPVPLPQPPHLQYRFGDLPQRPRRSRQSRSDLAVCCQWALETWRQRRFQRRGGPTHGRTGHGPFPTFP